jgi:hypothetical protein
MYLWNKARATEGSVMFFGIPRVLLRTAISSGAGAQKALLPFGANAFQEHLPEAFFIERVAHVK